MISLIALAFYIQIPVIIGGVLHMVVVTRDYFPGWYRPLWVWGFGANKTWRGLLVVPLVTMFGALCLWPVEAFAARSAVFGDSLLSAGFCAGLGYVLAELPNSFLKRRLGIPPGTTPARGGAFFIFLDQFDSGLGMAVAYAWLPGLPLEVCALTALTFPLTALVVKQGLYLAGLKKSPT